MVNQATGIYTTLMTHALSFNAACHWQPNTKLAFMKKALEPLICYYLGRLRDEENSLNHAKESLLDQYLKYGGITTQMGSDKWKVGTGEWWW